jgi:hypothetical protein
VITTRKNGHQNCTYWIVCLMGSVGRDQWEEISLTNSEGWDSWYKIRGVDLVGSGGRSGTEIEVGERDEKGCMLYACIRWM